MYFDLPIITFFSLNYLTNLFYVFNFEIENIFH